MRTACLAVCTVALFAFVLTGLRWLAAESRRDAAEESRLSDGWEEQRQYFLWSHQYREHAIQAVIAGEISLPEGAACFDAIESQRPRSLALSYTNYPGTTKEEQICRQVYHYIDGILWKDPRQVTVMKRLDAELSAFLDRGPPPLPTPPVSAFRPRAASY